MITVEERLWSKYGNGKRDATAFIQLMINRAYGIVSIPHGTYLCKETLKISGE